MAVILDPIDIKLKDMKYGVNPNEEEFDHKLSKEIWGFLLKNCLNYKILSKKIRLRNHLSDLFSKYFNEISNGLKFVDLFISGSTLNGFATLDSDLDLCFVIEDNYQFEFCKSKKVKILSDIEEILDLNGFKLSDCQLIEARVPILRFIDSGSKIQVEINVNNELGIRNTRLLYCYSKRKYCLLFVFICFSPLFVIKLFFIQIFHKLIIYLSQPLIEFITLLPHNCL